MKAFSLLLLVVQSGLLVSVTGKFLEFADLDAEKSAALEESATKLAENYCKMGVVVKPESSKPAVNPDLEKCKELLKKEEKKEKKEEKEKKKEEKKEEKKLQEPEKKPEKKPLEPLKDTPTTKQQPKKRTSNEDLEPTKAAPIISTAAPEPRKPVAPTEVKPKPIEDILIDGTKDIGLNKHTPQTKVPFQHAELKEKRFLYSVRPTKDLQLNIQLFTLDFNYQPTMRIYSHTGSALPLKRNDANNRYFELKKDEQYFIEVGMDSPTNKMDLYAPKSEGDFIVYITTNSESIYKALQNVTITAKDPKSANERTNYRFEGLKPGSKAIQTYKSITNDHGLLNTDLAVQFDPSRPSFTFHWLGGSHNGCGNAKIRQSLTVQNSDTIELHDDNPFTKGCTYNVTIKHNCFKHLFEKLKPFVSKKN